MGEAGVNRAKEPGGDEARKDFGLSQARQDNPCNRKNLVDDCKSSFKKRIQINWCQKIPFPLRCKRVSL